MTFSIAYGAKRWRVVTLDGKIIDISGTMSGGGSNPARGGMTRSVQANTDPEALKTIILQNNSLADVYQYLITFIINFLILEGKECRASKVK